jgi:hypothetical protein
MVAQQRLKYEKEIHDLQAQVIKLTNENHQPVHIPLEPLPIVERHTIEIRESGFSKTEDLKSIPTPPQKDLDKELREWEIKQAEMMKNLKKKCFNIFIHP